VGGFDWQWHAERYLLEMGLGRGVESNEVEDKFQRYFTENQMSIGRQAVAAQIVRGQQERWKSTVSGSRDATRGRGGTTITCIELVFWLWSGGPCAKGQIY
jgi:hypothetical protein